MQHIGPQNHGFWPAKCSILQSIDNQCLRPRNQTRHTIMKTTAKHIAIVGLAAMALASCTDGFLDTSSKTSLNTTTCYKTSEQAQTALVGCFDQNLKVDATDIFSDIWSDYYKSIYNSNLLIQSLPSITFASDDYRNRGAHSLRLLQRCQYTRETRFLADTRRRDKTLGQRV